MKYSIALLVVSAISMVQASAKNTLSKCQQKHEEALESRLIGNFMPRCEPNGSYSPRQCFASTGYCFCVDTETGEVISDPVSPTGDIAGLNC
ncbi:SPARC-related modular calcium-binding protein 2 [Mucor circinelloides]